MEREDRDVQEGLKDFLELEGQALEREHITEATRMAKERWERKEVKQNLEGKQRPSNLLELEGQALETEHITEATRMAKKEWERKEMRKNG